MFIFGVIKRKYDNTTHQIKSFYKPINSKMLVKMALEALIGLL